MDWLAKCICKYVYLSLVIQTSLLTLPYSPLLPSAWGRKYIHIPAKELLGLHSVTGFSLTLCLWILCNYVVYSLYINIIFAATVCKQKLPDSIVWGIISQPKMEAWNEVSVNSWSSRIQELCTTPQYRWGFVCILWDCFTTEDSGRI